MTSNEFSQMCRELWGYGWKKKAAEHLGINRHTVSFYASGISRAGHLATIKQETAIKLRAIFEVRNANN